MLFFTAYYKDMHGNGQMLWKKSSIEWEYKSGKECSSRSSKVDGYFEGGKKSQRILNGKKKRRKRISLKRKHNRLIFDRNNFCAYYSRTIIFRKRTFIKIMSENIIYHPSRQHERHTTDVLYTLYTNVQAT